MRLHELQELAKKLPSNWYITGGCVRDALRGAEGKDIDIVVLPYPVFQDATRILWNLFDTVIDESVQCASAPEADRNLDEVHQFTCDGIPIDLLFYDCSDIYEVLEQLDVNANAVAIDNTGAFQADTEFAEWLFGGRLYTLRQDIRPERIAYIQERLGVDVEHVGGSNLVV